MSATAAEWMSPVHGLSTYYSASYIAWYSNIDNTQSGNDHPDSLSSEYRDWSNGGKLTQPVIQMPLSQRLLVLSLFFRVTVRTHIDSDGRDRAFTGYAGWAQRTSDGKVFNCYRDNERQIFAWGPPVPDGTNYAILCLSEYCILPPVFLPHTHSPSLAESLSMKFSTLFITSLSFVPSLVAAAAIPDAALRNETLSKRGGEVNYISNCARIDPNVGSQYSASYIAWYSNVDNSQSGNDVGGYLHWEGQQQNIYFPDSGVSVQTHIDSNADGRAFTAYAGWAQRTSDGKVFNCYRDNERQLFIWSPPVPDGTNLSIVCTAKYWCV
ncbi:hypothetical protein M407DRAFT_28085 [Tulasnella calospora MUT 4182]|uniref:Uncharacterized protein n=1 Tax=Tulasnella calospora MUT 4182 TaxID=1051891 RepID=A0A0C3Q207_9AGAM|nr:hypothetical protein M407DRAFT_28085 [Tulasnella calospora MUT 4182]